MRDIEEFFSDSQKSGRARREICLCGINSSGKTKYISTKNLFKNPQRAGVDKIRLAYPLKKHLGVEVD